MGNKNSIKYALEGIITAFREEVNLRIQLIIGILVVIASIIFKVSSIEFIILIFSILIVICLEMMNTIVELICDFISPEWDLRIKKIKDISAAMVLIASFLTVIIGISIFYKYIIKLI